MSLWTLGFRQEVFLSCSLSGGGWEHGSVYVSLNFVLVIRVVFQRVLLGVRRLLVASVGFLGGVRRRILE